MAGLVNWRILTIFGGILLLAVPAAAVDRKQIDAAIAQLADPDGGVRDKAAKVLWNAGREAEAALLEALKSDDPEVVARSREILADFRFGIYPDTPVEIATHLRAYRAGTPIQKRTAVLALVRMGRRGLPAAVGLSKAEQDSTLRAQVFHELAQLGDKGAAAFLAEGDLKSAEQCLEVGLAATTARPSLSYAAFLVHSGGAAEKITQLKEAMALGDGISHNARTLAYLLRAKGDLAGAREAA